MVRLTVVGACTALLGSALTVTAPSVTAVPSICPTIVAPPQAGDGFYELSTPAHLQWVKDADVSSTNAQWAYDYRLTSNIDMTGCLWDSGIGSSSTQFTGELDGGGLSISNLTMEVTQNDANAAYAGLFPYLGSNATVRDLDLSGSVAVNKTGGNATYAGLLAGYTTGSTITVSSVTVSGAVTVTTDGSAYVGGSVGGCSSEVTITQVTIDATVTATSGASSGVGYAGGLCGFMRGVANSLTVAGSVSATGYDLYVGGIAGYSLRSVFVDAESAVDVTSDGGGVALSRTFAGGIVGRHVDDTSLSGTSTGSITVTDTETVYVGGVAGEINQPIQDAHAEGAVFVTNASGTSYVGGLAGAVTNATVSGSSATGSVTVTNLSGAFSAGKVGGLIGQADGAVSRSYATGDISVMSSTTGPVMVGGLLGQQNSTASEVFASGDVSVTSTAGSGSSAVSAGGVSGNSYIKDISNGYSLGNVTVTTDFHLAAAGGISGYGGGGTITETYAAGSVSASTTGPQGAWPAGSVTDRSGASLVRGFCVSQVASSCSPAAAAGSRGTFATVDELRTLLFFKDAGWSISPGYSESTTWGICSTFNQGFPFLNVLYSTDPCTVQSSAGHPVYADFAFFLPDGSECTSISPMRVQVGTSVELPGREALCRTMPGAVVAGWTIPVPPGFTGAGSSSLPFSPGHEVEVVDSQRFTVVPFEPVLELEFGANVGEGIECVASDAPDRRADDRVMWVWVPRVDASLARFPDRASCTPTGHVLVGWNTRGDGTGEVFRPGTSLPQGWQSDPTNRRTLHAMWAAA